jgi:hypothetical protein
MTGIWVTRLELAKFYNVVDSLACLIHCEQGIDNGGLEMAGSRDS